MDFDTVSGFLSLSLSFFFQQIEHKTFEKTSVALIWEKEIRKSVAKCDWVGAVDILLMLPFLKQYSLVGFNNENSVKPAI